MQFTTELHANKDNKKCNASKCWEYKCCFGSKIIAADKYFDFETKTNFLTTSN